MGTLLPGLLLTGSLQGQATAGNGNDLPDDGNGYQLPDYEVEGRERLLTSPKFPQPLRDVPLTLDVIPSALIEDQGASSLRDVLRNTPGITFQAGEGGSAPGDNLFIRGFNARTDIFVDGVRNIGDYARDSFNFEQVEVAKGPASAFTGRGSTGGSVNIVTKSPLTSPFVRLNAEVGTADHLRGTLDVNQPLDPEADQAVRFNAMWTESGVAGRDEVENSRWGIAPAYAFGVGENTRVTLKYQRLEMDNLPDYGLWRDATTDPNYDWSDFYGLTRRDYEKIQSDLLSGEVVHDIGEHYSLRNFTRYGRTTRNAAVTSPRLDRSDPTLASRSDLKTQDRENEILSNQTDVSAILGEADLRHNIVAGLELSAENYKDWDREQIGESPTTDLYNPTPNEPWNGEIVRTGAMSDAEATTVALYGFDTLEIGEHWQLTGGVRWERFDAEVESRDEDGARETLSRTDEMLSYRMAAVYKPVENLSLYAGVGNSFNPSAEGLTLSEESWRGPSVSNNPNLEPEENRSYEIGTKWDLNESHLSFTAAIFRTEKLNARELNANDEPVLTGHQTVDGIEVGLSGFLTDRWYVYGGYAYMESEAESGTTEDTTDIAYVPAQSFNFWTTLAVSDRITIGAGAQYTGDYFYRNTSDESTIPEGVSYWLLDAMVTYEVNSNFSLRLNIDNLTDERYIERGYAAHFTPGPRRSATLTGEFRF